MMKAIYIKQYGAVKDVVRFGEMPKPKPHPDEVLIEVHAASVNPVDFKRVSGATKLVMPYTFPAVIGYDVSGVVVEVGKNVRHFSVGDEVYTAFTHQIGSGAFAEYATAPESALAFKPRNLSHAEAASIPVVGLTSWQAFTDVFKLRAGHKVLIHAGAGGVGTFAIQLAKYLGAMVATTASASKHELVKSLGADVIVDYRTDNFRRLLKDCDLVLDTLGGQGLMDSFYCLRRGGMVISISGAPDKYFGKAMRLNPFVRVALWAMNRSVYRVARETETEYRFLLKSSRGEDLAAITDLVERRIIHPVIDRSYPLAQAADALEYLQTGHATGKVVLTIR
jgi:NADPH:quinone reductase-like Zn-dependent oxidoreductase